MSVCAANIRTGDHPRVPGIIPACAGNTYPAWCHLRIMRDHPRVCGEHKPRRRQPTARPGSSPRVRGTRALAEVAVDEQGIIPACAGNTVANMGYSQSDRDHPRVCGEHVCGGLLVVSCWGSSPRVRGTPIDWQSAARLGGIIPACAGNTLF